MLTSPLARVLSLVAQQIMSKSNAFIALELLKIFTDLYFHPLGN